jgi:hypothetical protein
MPEKEIKIQLSVKVPKLRLWAYCAAMWLVYVFVRSEIAQGKASDWLGGWLKSGLRVYADGKLVR